MRRMAPDTEPAMDPDVPKVHGKPLAASPSRFRRVSIAVAAVIAVATLVLVVRAAMPSGVSHRAPGSAPYVTIFVLDGVSDSLLSRAVRSGRAPNIARMAEHGTQVRSAVTAFPSITGYAFIPMVTGQDAAESGVLGLRWWDRSRKVGPFRTYVGPPNVNMERDLSTDLTTLFDAFKDQHSLSVLTYMGRGAETKAKPAWPLITSKYDNIWFFRLGCTLLPFICTSWVDLPKVPAGVAIEDLKLKPKVQLVVFPNPDGYHHVNANASKFYDMVPAIDRSIGDFQKASEKLGQEKDRIYLIVGDHGMAEVSHNLQVTKQFEKNYGFTSYRGPSVVFKSELDQPIDSFDGYDIIECINGNLMDFIYLRHYKNGWTTDPIPHELLVDFPAKKGISRINMPLEFAKTEGVELVIFRGPGQGTVRVLDTKGEGEISSSDGDTISYRVVQGQDPLKLFKDDKTVTRTAAEWLKTAYKSYYPYATVRLWRMMHNKDASAGDIVLLSAYGYDFGLNFELFTGNYKGGHGGLRADNMLVPAILYGRGVAQASIETAALEDVGATLVQLVNASKSKRQIRGRVLQEALAHKP